MMFRLIFTRSTLNELRDLYLDWQDMELGGEHAAGFLVCDFLKAAGLWEYENLVQVVGSREAAILWSEADAD